LVPSTLNQVLLGFSDEKKNTEFALFAEPKTKFDKLSICTQWPANCTVNDGRFSDGGFSDGPTLALNVASYQNQPNADLTAALTGFLLWRQYWRHFLGYFFYRGVSPSKIRLSAPS
jgi:hypothetical protein